MSLESPPHRATKRRFKWGCGGLLETPGSITWLQEVSSGTRLVFNSKPSGYKLVGIHNRMGMKFASKFIGALVVKSQLFKLIKGVFSVAGPTNTQKDGVEDHKFSINEFVEICMLPLCRLQVLSRQCAYSFFLQSSIRHCGALCKIQLLPYRNPTRDTHFHKMSWWLRVRVPAHSHQFGFFNVTGCPLPFCFPTFSYLYLLRLWCRAANCAWTPPTHIHPHTSTMCQLQHSFTFPTHPSGLSSAPGRPGSHHDDVYPTGWGGPETCVPSILMPNSTPLLLPLLRDWESHSGGGPGYTSWTSPAAGLDAGTAAGPGAGAAAGRPPAQKQRHDEPPEALAAGAAAKATGSPVGAPLIPVYESGAERGAGMVTGGGPTPIPWEGVPRQARQGAPK
eukprot:1155105-Pelagomonas_calceolata.AAC.6